MADQTLRERFERRKADLKRERQSFDEHYKELAQFVQPRRGRFFTQDRNRGGDRYNAIINSRATQAHRVARAGLLAGSMSPAAKWFELGTFDKDLNKRQPVREWFYHAREVLLEIFAASNMYSAASTTLGELILFATGCELHVDDFEDVARFYPLTVGSYWIAQDERQVVNTLVREWEMTASQMVARWGKDKVSRPVREAYDKGNYDAWFPVTHIIEPNVEYRDGNKLAKFKKFRSCYYEPGNTEKEALLNDSGFDSFPVYAPRWDTTGEDVYGTDCPGMVALGDVKGLQIEERRKAQAIDMMVRPPLTGPASVRNVPIDGLPGGVTIYDGGGNGQKLEPLYQVQPRLQEMRIDIQAVEQRIDHAFYVHLFRAISDMQGVQPRNQLELQKREQERLLELGPALEHLHAEYLAKKVTRTFEQAAKAGIFRPAPPELQGRAINVKFISTLAMAQRSVAAGAIERLATFVAGLVPFAPGAAQKFDVDDAVETYAEVIGAPPALLVSDEDVAAIRQAEMERAQAAQQAAVMGAAADAAQKGAGAAKALGETQAGGDTLLSRVNDAIKQRAAANAFTR